MIRLDRVLLVRKSWQREYSHSFRSGAWTTITGPSGAGKSSLLDVVAGLVIPVSGRLEIGGRNMEKVPPGKRNLAMVTQDNSLFLHLSLRKNLLLAQHDIPVPGTQKKRNLEEITERFGLKSDQLVRMPQEVSGGELTRFNICAALLRKKSLLILDEPVASLNQNLQKHVVETLREITADLQMTVLCVSHQIDEVRKATDEFCKLDLS